MRINHRARITAALLALLLAVGISYADAGERTAPLIRGTLWWLSPPFQAWEPARLEQAVQAQREAGFDLLWLLNTPALLPDEGAAAGRDIVRELLDAAAARGMRVLLDLPQGGWHGKTSAGEMTTKVVRAAERTHAHYGDHPAFCGWYLNYEINPIVPGDTEESTFWRETWRAITSACHRLAPESIVTISPFFLLDEARRRGFVYLTPEQYAAWWGETLKATGIDVLMLQDSGEHLSFFTLEDREAFWAATAAACRAAGAEFWLNVESGEMVAKDWDDYLRRQANGETTWRVTPRDWLERKLRRASHYADHIVNWGYFPFMNPDPVPSDETQWGITPETARAVYAGYRAYYRGIAGNTWPAHED